MKKTGSGVIIALMAALLLTLSGCATSAATPAPQTSSAAPATAASTSEPTAPATAEPPVKLTIYTGISAASGVQDNPVAKQIQARTGVIMDFVAGDSDVTKFQAMVAADDLPDVFVFVGESATFNPDNLIISKQVIPLDDLIAQYGMHITDNVHIKRGLEIVNSLLTQKGDSKYYIISMANAGINNGYNRPMCSNYIRWDAYVAAGKPAVKTSDDLLSALKKMQEAVPQTPDGKRVYAMGFWFGDDPGWAEWPLEVMSFAQGYYDYPVNLQLNIKLQNYDSPLPCAMNPQSQWWKNVQFLNKAYRMGLIDPDSFIQKGSDWDAKRLEGRYLWILPSWNVDETNEALAKLGIKDGFVLAPPLDGTDKMIIQWKTFKNGVKKYMVSAKCKNPDKAVTWLDYIASDEGTRLVINGVEGQTWNVVNGVPTLTDEAYQNYFDDNFRTKNGLIYGISGMSCDDLAPDGYPYGLYYTPDAVAKRVQPFEQDAMTLWGFPDPGYNNGLAADSYITDIGEVALNRTSDASIDEQLKATDKADADYKTYILTEVYKAIMAKSDEEYTNVQNEIIAKGEALGMKERYQIIYDALTKQVDATKQELGIK